MTDMNEKIKSASQQQHQDTEDQEQPQSEQLIYFNYNEYVTPGTKGIQQQPLADDDNEDQDSEISLVVNHFPNVYEDMKSTTFMQTRIIRIPRIYDTLVFPELIPQFSKNYPGTESGAILLNDPMFGKFDDEIFNESSSILGLEKIISRDQFEDIIDHINDMLVLAFDPYNKWTFLENILELLTGGLFLQILNLLGIYSYTRRKIQQLEEYVNEINNDNLEKNIEFKVISPRVSGYLSVCVNPNTINVYKT